jgi:hypothetical protein
MTIGVPVQDLPTPEAEVWLLRYTLDPGASLTELQQVGPTLLLVEQGEVTLTSDGPLTFRSQTATRSPVAPTPSTGSTTVAAGEGAFIAGGTRLGVRNDTAQQSRLLVLKVFAPDQKHLADIPGLRTTAPSGVTVQPISNGPAPFPGGSGFLVIERDVVDAGQSAVSGIYSGVEVGAVEGGMARVMFLDGQNWFRPRILADYAEAAVGGPVPLHPRATLELTADDGFMSRQGSLVWRSTGNDPLVIIRGVAASIHPEPVRSRP